MRGNIASPFFGRGAVSVEARAKYSRRAKFDRSYWYRTYPLWGALSKIVFDYQVKTVTSSSRLVMGINNNSGVGPISDPQ